MEEISLEEIKIIIEEEIKIITEEEIKVKPKEELFEKSNFRLKNENYMTDEEKKLTALFESCNLTEKERKGILNNIEKKNTIKHNKRVNFNESTIKKDDERNIEREFQTNMINLLKIEVKLLSAENDSNSYENFEKLINEFYEKGKKSFSSEDKYKFFNEKNKEILLDSSKLTLSKELTLCKMNKVQEIFIDLAKTISLKSFINIIPILAQTENIFNKKLIELNIKGSIIGIKELEKVLIERENEKVLIEGENENELKEIFHNLKGIFNIGKNENKSNKVSEIYQDEPKNIEKSSISKNEHEKNKCCLLF